jgi:hypothetical protein
VRSSACAFDDLKSTESKTYVLETARQPLRCEGLFTQLAEWAELASPLLFLVSLV